MVPCDWFLSQKLEDGRPHHGPLVLERQLLTFVLQHAVAVVAAASDVAVVVAVAVVATVAADNLKAGFPSFQGCCFERLKMSKYLSGTVCLT